MIGKFDLLQHLCGRERAGRDLFDQRDVFMYRQGRHKIVKLKDIADRGGSVFGQFVIDSVEISFPYTYRLLDCQSRRAYLRVCFCPCCWDRG